MVESLIERLRGLGRERWREPGAATEAQVAAVEARWGVRLPSAYRELLRASGGGWLHGFTTRLELFPIEDLDWKGVEEHLVGDLTGTFAIGTDGGDSVFVLDPKGRLGRGEGALFLVELGTLRPGEAKLVGRDLGEVVCAILADESLWDRPTLDEEAATGG